MPTLDEFPRFRLGFFPTPVTPLSRLSAELGGPALFIKRDDQSGLALGGNKVRKLEMFVGDALAQGCDTLITGGAAQSNHCRQTAAAAAQAGLACHLVLGGEAPSSSTGNLLLDELLGAEVHWAGEQRKGEPIPALARELTRAGRKPYAIPYGGSNDLGTCGFVHAAHELAEQERDLGEPFTHVVVATSSGGTQAGLVVGDEVPGRVIGVCIDKELVDGATFPDHVRSLARRTAERIGASPPGDESFQFWEGYAGAGYGVVTDMERNAIETLARAEGILLDPVYTARAFGALLDRVRGGAFSSTDRVLFWHTGGAPALFAYRAQLS